MADPAEKVEFRKVMEKLNLLMIILPVELVPIALLAAYFLLMIAAHMRFFGGD
jgi:hypothetical protein